ncbi:MAG: SUMF1/EgtB/PvdO family nonheme iron enzyme [Treponema sp.]|nr:SUMF1/EgtB/PvdO family nonheme iron enzyme [Treponema sp.]
MSLKLYKDLIDDCSVACIPESGNVKSLKTAFVEKANPFSYSEDILNFAEGVGIPIWNGEVWQQIVNQESFTMNPANLLDTGNELVFGNDYYGYICMDSGSPEIVFSKNDSFPDGSAALTSRKFCHFYYGTIRKVSDDGLWIPIDSAGNKFGSSGTKWQDNVTVGIVPNSVWDLKHKPKISHPGLVEVNGVWLGAFQASAEEAFTFMSATNGLHVTSGKLATKYGAIPVTGTEGMNQFTFNEIAHKQGLRLPRYEEWLAGAFGSPQGENGANNYAWAKTTNTARTFTGCSVNTSTGAYDGINGVKPFAISAYNLHDCVGNVSEWTNDYSIKQDSTSWAWQNVLGAGMGQACLPFSGGMSALICGNNWDDGVLCGPRSVNLDSNPWNVNVLIGARLACDAA